MKCIKCGRILIVKDSKALENYSGIIGISYCKTCNKSYRVKTSLGKRFGGKNEFRR